jgi:V/A-type H+-transporting ATPase subunit C
MRLLEKRSGFAYTNTRVRAMKTQLLELSDFNRLLKMSSAEIARFLGETQYKKEINELATRFEGIDLIELALNKNLANTFKKILDFSVKEAKTQIQLYLQKFDYWNIKTILRGKNSNALNEEILLNLIPAGSLSEDLLKKIVLNSSTIEEAIELFKGTQYYDFLKKKFVELKGNLSLLEDELDIEYYNNALSIASPELKEFLQKEIDIRNTLNFLRAQISNIKFKPIPGGTIKEFKFKKPVNFDELKVKLRKEFLTQSRKLLHTFKLSVQPIIGFFIAKELEVKNLRLIARGKHAKLPLELIEKHLVV